MTDGDPIVYDLTPERALLGAAMMSPELVREIFLALEPDDWFSAASRNVAAVIATMLVAGRPVDPETVLVEASNRGLVPARVNPHFLVECTQHAALPEAAVVHAERIKGLAALRHLNQAAQRLEQRTNSAWETGVDRLDLDSHIREMRGALDQAERTAGDLDYRPPVGIAEYLESISLGHDWLVPGLLERMDRIVLTGAEGGGKSVACRQVACTLAAGLHPFTAALLGSGGHRARVLYVDCENSPQQSSRQFRWMINNVDQRRRNLSLSPMDWNESMSLEVRPAGIDLLASKDTVWLERAISAFAPDLLVCGPLYKLHHENPNDEKPAREIAWVLDGLRERYKFALLTEAHAGKSTTGDGRRNMAPIGSSMWLRWPEFGFGLLRSKDDTSKGRAELVDVVSWRGSREERAWPSQLQYSHVLPWMPADPEYYDQMRQFA